jgi:uncharacterized membrane protein YesL
MNRLPPVLRVFGQAMADWWDGWLPLMLINFAASICVLFILPGPPAIFALYVVANELAHGRSVDFGDFTAGLRRYFFKSWQWAVPNLLVAFLVWIALRYYGTLGSELGTVLQVLVIVVAAVWIMVQFFALPYLIEQQDKRLILAWRNGLFTSLASPLFTLSAIIVAILIVVISIATVALVFLGGACLFALFGTRVVFNRLEAFNVRERDAQRST